MMYVYTRDRGADDWLGWALTKKTLVLRKYLYPIVNSGECVRKGQVGG